MSDKAPRYQRILLKLSGEALAGKNDMGIDSGVLDSMSLAIAHLVGLGVQVGIVVGGGNLYRGAALQKQGLVGRVTGDQMGMLATVMNGLAMRDALERRNIKCRLMSALPIGEVTENRLITITPNTIRLIPAMAGKSSLLPKIKYPMIAVNTIPTPDQMA